MKITKNITLQIMQIMFILQNLISKKSNEKEPVKFVLMSWFNIETDYVYISFYTLLYLLHFNAKWKL